MTRSAARLLPIVLVTALAAALRLPTLDRQSYWLDELVTVSLLDRSLGDVLREVPRTEATPYLYYVLAWLWSSAFGLGEVGLRSLSALAGTATVPVAYLAGTVLVSRRASLVAAALVATNPFLVWYSQEARSYALLALVAAGSVLAFGHALRGGTRALVAWALVAALALATHYFAVFLVAAEAAWLLVRLRPVSRPVLATLLPAAVLAAQVPLVLAQRGNGEAVSGSPLASRILGIPKNLVVGYSFPVEALGSALAAALLLVGIVLLGRVAAGERRGALAAGSLALATILIPVVLALGGVDFLVSRNTIAAIVPAAVCLGAGYATGRLGVATAAALCTLAAAIALVPALDTSYGRTDWRGAAEALRRQPRTGAIVVTPYMSRTLWRPYLPALDEPDGSSVVVKAITVVGLATEGGYSAGHVEPPSVATPKALPGFRVVSVERRPTFTLVRYVAERPTPVAIERLARLALTDEQPGILLEGARAAAR